MIEDEHLTLKQLAVLLSPVRAFRNSGTIALAIFDFDFDLIYKEFI